MTGQKPDKGPCYLGKFGSVKIPVYETQTRTGKSWVVSWYEGKKRFRKAYADLTVAKESADRRARTIAKLGSGARDISGEERLEYIRAHGIAAQYGVSLDVAVTEWAEAKKLLGDIPLIRAAKAFIKISPEAKQSPRIEDLVSEFVEAKRAVGRSTYHVNDLRKRLDKFKGTFKCRLEDITVTEIEAWVNGMKNGHRSNRNYLAAVSGLVRFAERRGYVGKGVLDISTVERGRSHGEVSIYTPSELRTLLSSARPDMVPYIALGAFAGVRSAEIARLDWSEIGTDFIHIRAGKAKTRSRRLVPVLPALESWIKGHRKENGPVCPLASPFGVLAEYAKKGGCKWKVNALRHSFGTYRLAITKNEMQTALEMGNSPGMIFQHYRALVTEDQAREWFAVGTT